MSSPLPVRPLRIGTRGSRLALAQTALVASRLEAQGVPTRVVEIRTSGDRIRDVPLGPDLGSSFFTKEIESALLDGEIDLAVHSAKDLATRLPTGLEIAAFPEREDPRDVIVARDPSVLKSGAIVGTSSPRRKRFLAFVRPGLKVVDQRGNVPTRVQAVEDGVVDAAVLAAAGLVRLGLEERISAFFDPAELLPAAGQGALAVQCRSDDEETETWARTLDHEPTRTCVEMERAFLRRLNAGCHAPAGVLAEIQGSETRVRGGVAGPGDLVRVEYIGPRSGEAIGVQVAEDLLARLGVESLADVDWAGPPSVGVERSK